MKIHTGPPLTVTIIRAVQGRITAVQIRFVCCTETQALSRAQSLQNESLILGLGAGGAGGLAAAAGLICNVQIKKKKKGSSEEKETCCMLSVKTAAEVQGKEQATADSQSRCDMKGFGVRGEKG